jgi:hypothetical protein
MARLDRFLRLEKRHPAAASQAPALGSPERFSPEPPLEERPLRVLQDDVMPFVRCCVCRADSHVAALTCPNCGSDLGTPVQRAFNQALARDYQQRRVEEEEDADEVRAARARADREAREAQRQALDSLLRMKRGQAGIPGRTDGDPPIGLRLARRIHNPRLRLAALVSGAAAPLALIVGGAPQVGLPLLALVAAAFAPRRVRRMIWED